MSTEVQLDIWEETYNNARNENRVVWDELFVLSEKYNNLRRGLLRSFSDMKKEVALLRDEVAYLNEKKQQKPVILIT